jgi:hypothetical protein
LRSQKRDYQAIERTSIIGVLLARDEASLAAERRMLAVLGTCHGFASTVPEITDLIGRYQEAGMQLLISSAYKNDLETHELKRTNCLPPT